MSYKSILATVFGKRPVWLYQITLGADVHYLTTRSGGVTTPIGKPNVSFTAATTWTPTPLHRGKINQTGNLLEAEMEISLPASLPIAAALVADVSFNVATIRVWHGFENDPDGEFVQRFEGRITKIRTGADWVKIGCENDETVAKRPAGSVVIQRPCRRVVYEPLTGCPVDFNAQAVPATITAKSGLLLTFTETIAHDDGWYSNGRIKFGGVTQMITNHTATQFRILADIPAIDVEIAASGSASVQIARGCRNIVEDCVYFGAHLDFGGFQYMTESPFDGRLLS